MTWPAVAFFVSLFIFLLPNIRIAQEGERLVVFRLGRFHRILGPGLNLIIWGVEMPRRVELNTVVPDWQSLSEEELSARIEQMARSGQLSPIS